MARIAFSTIFISARENVPARYHSPQQLISDKITFSHICYITGLAQGEYLK